MAPVGRNGLKRDRSTAWDDEEIVKQAAREFVHRHGTAARRFLSEYAEIADGLGDELSATAWCDIADAVERLQRPEKPLPSPLSHVDVSWPPRAERKGLVGCNNRAGTNVVVAQSAAFTGGVVMTDNEIADPRGASGMALSLRARIARYREQAEYFARLAEGEPVARIRDQWKELARVYASLASGLENG